MVDVQRRWQRKDTKKNNQATFNSWRAFILDAYCRRRLIVFHFVGRGQRRDDIDAVAVGVGSSAGCGLHRGPMMAECFHTGGRLLHYCGMGSWHFCDVGGGVAVLERQGDRRPLLHPCAFCSKLRKIIEHRTERRFDIEIVGWCCFGVRQWQVCWYR